MARKSLAALSITPTSLKKRPVPPQNLPSESAALWCTIVDSLPLDAFSPSDLPLLSAYVLAAHHKAAADVLVARDGLVIDNKPNAAIGLSMQLSASMATLAGKLRLCPSSRTRPESASLKKQFTGVRPWETTTDVSEYFS